MKKIFLCSLILFCNSAFADGCENTLFLMGCDVVNNTETDYCTYCTSEEDNCAKQTMDENTATLPSKPSGGDMYCCVKNNTVYVYDSWNIHSYLGDKTSYGAKGFGEKITVIQEDGYFAFPITENVSKKNGLCNNDGVYSDCPLNKKCENGFAVDCAAGKYCENGVEQICPKGYKCVDGKKTACNTPGYYCEGGTEKKCPAGSYCTGDGHKQDCPAPQNSDEGADAKTDCYISSSTRFCDGKDKCFNLSDIDTINTKIFIKN